MRNSFHNDIMDILLRNGKDGMNVRRLARQIYNHHCGIFSQDIVYDKLYNQIRFYLWRQSQLRHSPFIHLRRGQYALKQDIAVQLDIFIDAPREDDHQQKAIKRDESRQLMLF